MTRTEIHVEPLAPVERDDAVILRARIHGHPHWRKRNGILWFEVPAELSDWLVIQGKSDDLHDPLVRAAIFPAMEAGGKLRIHGNVSASLLANLEVFQEILTCWMPESFRPVEMWADQEVAISQDRLNRRSNGALLAFSGGMDSIHALYSHQRGLRGRNTLHISHCLFVHGFDIPLRDGCVRQAFQHARQLAEALESRLIPVRTNLKRLLPAWPFTFSAAVAALLSLFERQYATGLIASSVTYQNPFRIIPDIAFMPLSDPRLSSDTFRIEHDANHKSRVEKCEIFREFPMAAKRVRVCWSGEDLSRNCGRCEKCLRQMLCMKAVGVDDLSAFQAPLSAQSILALGKEIVPWLEEWKACYAEGERNGLAQSAPFAAIRDLLAACGENVSPSDAGHGRRKKRSLAARLRKLGMKVRDCLPLGLLRPAALAHGPLKE